MRWILVVGFAVGFLSGASLRVGNVPDVAMLGLNQPLTRDVEFIPPLEYERWWQHMERCTGLRGKMRSWEYRINPDDALALTPIPGIVVVAETDHYARTITLSAPRLFDSLVVQHEMIHALGIHEHRYDIFVRRCKVNTDESIRWQDRPLGLPG